LKEVYKKQIHIKIGFEIDYIDNQEDKINSYFNRYKSRLDFIIASIHVLNSDRGLWGMDDIIFSQEYDAIGTDNVYSQYYEVLRNMINTKEFDFDIIGHFDLPKKFNKIPKNKELIMSEIIETLELAKKRDVTIEINTAGFRKDVKEQYPSIDIIKKLYELDIPILLGSDAHSPNELAWQFKSIIKTLKKIGYNQLASFEKRKRSLIEI
jgi:histidinol-phosphatase (PHP family)